MHGNRACGLLPALDVPEVLAAARVAKLQMPVSDFIVTIKTHQTQAISSLGFAKQNILSCRIALRYHQA